MGFLFKKKDDNVVNEKKSSGILKYLIPIGIGLYAKSKSNKRKENEEILSGEKVLGGLFRKTGKGIFRKK